MKYEVNSGKEVFSIEIEQDGSLLIDGEKSEYDFGAGMDPSQYSLLLENRSYELRVSESEEEYRVVIQGESIPVTVIDERSRHLLAAREALGGGGGEQLIKAPMPGLVVDVLVKAGDEMKKYAGNPRVDEDAQRV